MKVVLGTGLPELNDYVRSLPVQILFEGQSRDEIIDYLNEQPSGMPDLVLLSDLLPGQPKGVLFPLDVRRYARWVRVLWLAKEGFSEADHRKCSDQAIEVVVGQIRASELAQRLLKGSQAAANQLGKEIEESPAPVVVEPDDTSSIRPEPTEETVEPVEAVSEGQAATADMDMVEPGPVDEGGQAEINVVPEPVVAQPDTPKRRMVVVWSPKSEGATTTTLFLSQEMVRSGRSTLAIDLNLTRPALRSCMEPDIKADGWDVLYAQLDAKVLASHHLTETVYQSKKGKGPAYLLGVNPIYASEYTKEHLELLLQVARETYDHVLVDIKADLDNYATEVALANADDVLVVLRPTWLSLQNYVQAREILEALGVDVSRHVILLNSRGDDTEYGKDNVATYCHAPVVGSLPFVPQMDAIIGSGQAAQGLGGSKTAREHRKVLRDVIDRLFADK